MEETIVCIDVIIYVHSSRFRKYSESRCDAWDNEKDDVLREGSVELLFEIKFRRSVSSLTSSFLAVREI